MTDPSSSDPCRTSIVEKFNKLKREYGLSDAEALEGLNAWFSLNNLPLRARLGLDGGLYDEQTGRPLDRVTVEERVTVVPLTITPATLAALQAAALKPPPDKIGAAIEDLAATLKRDDATREGRKPKKYYVATIAVRHGLAQLDVIGGVWSPAHVRAGLTLKKVGAPRGKPHTKRITLRPSRPRKGPKIDLP
jgi:hypothetical protein